MSLPKLNEYFSPKTPKQLTKLLGKYGDSALIVAGGTFVHGLAARDLLTEVEVLIDIQEMGLDTVTSRRKGLKLGAMATFAQLEALPEVRDGAGYGAIRDALTYPPVQIRNVGTIGGNVAAACPFFDLPTAFLALDATVIAVGPKGSRELALPDFFAGLFTNNLEDDEYVAAVSVPAPAAKAASAFLKLETNANDLAIVNVAVNVTMGGRGGRVCKKARVALGGGVGETIVRSGSAEDVLTGEKLTADVLKAAGEAVAKDIDPMSDHRASAEYRSLIAQVFTTRALDKALSRLN